MIHVEKQGSDEDDFVLGENCCSPFFQVRRRPDPTGSGLLLIFIPFSLSGFKKEL